MKGHKQDRRMRSLQ